MSYVDLHIQPKEKDLGDGFKVRRCLPHIKKRSVGPFVFWDHMGPAVIYKEKEMKVRAHPHIGLSTITYLFTGDITHRDSLANEQVIRPGEVNWMTAGKGIVHSERSQNLNTPDLLEGIQVWVALPKDKEDIEPSFVHKKEKDLPLFKGEGHRLRLIAGEFGGETSPLPVYSPLFYLSGWLKESCSYQLKLGDTEEAAIYIINGELELEGHTYSRFDLVSLTQGADLELKAPKDCEFMIFGGEPLPEKRHMWWNFVSHDKDKIEKAKEQWKSGLFPDVINETEHIPLPES